MFTPNWYQFFAGIGTEAAAGHGVEVRPGTVGPGVALQRALAERGEAVATVSCGGTFMAERTREGLQRILAAIAAARPAPAGPGLRHHRRRHRGRHRPARQPRPAGGPRRHPLGDPSLPAQDELRVRRRIVALGLRALQVTPAEGQIFEPGSEPPPVPARAG